jgi:sigma-B regulation protein RsbU (phosphoserine phosphatase)
MIVDGMTRRERQIEPEGIALGLVSGELFDHNEESEVSLKPGEVVLLYTDGVIEAMDQSSTEYGRERLVSMLEASEVDTAEDIIRHLVADIHQFTLGIPQHDDITLLALRILAPGEEVKSTVTTRQTA